MVGYVLVRVFAVVLLVAANAFFVATEFALISVRDTRIQQMIEAGRLGARKVLRLHEHLDDLLAAVQLGVTLASLGLGWVGEATLASVFEHAFEGLPHGAAYSHALGALISFLLITYLLVVLGELVPKSLALHRGERIALAVAGPMLVFMAVARPFLKIMSRSAYWVLRRFGTTQIRAAGVHSPEELKLMVRSSHHHGMIANIEHEMAVRALELGELTVRQIMVPRRRIFSLPADMPLEQALARVVEEQHSRVPVYDPQRGPEYIIGLLYSKDLTRWMRLRYTKGTAEEAGVRLAQMTVRDIMHHVLVVPETKPLTDLLVEFRRRKRHLAVVVDEFGSTSGVVTVEDVLEQVVGEIEDEFDVAVPSFPAGASTMVLDGSTTIRDLETQHHFTLPSDQGYETLAGFMLFQFQRIPRTGESVDYVNRRFTVLEMDGRRVAKVLVETIETKTGNQ
ncbi:MAG TPA: hemolysin family protein [Terriglobales bacterium]